MCGIAGFIDYGLETEEAKKVLECMGSAIRHRGPDDAGTYFDPKWRVGFSHTRLSIIDLTHQGSQPMLSSSGRYVIVYNGEIYNHQNLFSQLGELAQKIRGKSDTEILLRAIEVWGLEQALDKTVGMFAFCLLDRQEGLLYLVRDRMGEKPLYFGWQNNVFLFASELKALQQHPTWNPVVSPESVADLIRFGYIATQNSIYDGISKLPAATILCLNLAKRGEVETLSNWWPLLERRETLQKTPFQGSRRDAAKAVKAQLENTVKGQLVSDAPLGALLSGGIDSSLVSAIAQQISPNGVDTFTIGFDETNFDESGYARSVASALGTTHHEWVVTAREALNILPSVVSCFDEPFADSSQIPTFIVYRYISSEKKVVLSGDGGDELFGGYNRHYIGEELLGYVRKVPKSLQGLIGPFLSKIPANLWAQMSSKSGVAGWAKYLPNSPEHVRKLIRLLGVRSEREFYRILTEEDHKFLFAEPNSEHSQRIDQVFNASIDSFSEKMMISDLLTYLPDDILVKVDRASMANSVESRAPFLDHRMVDLASQIPLRFKIHNRVGKRVLRDVLKEFLPPELIDRPKMGFAVPVSEWLRGPLKTWALDLAARDCLADHGMFAIEPVQKLLSEHLSGKQDHGTVLWRILMFQAWVTR